MFKKALFPLDLSQTNNELISRAQFVSQLGTKYFHLIHVLTPGLGNREFARKRLEQVAIMLYSFGFGTTREVLEGSTADLICKVAQEKEVSFIYVPGRCKNIMHNILLGSTASDVVRLTEKPVFVHKRRPDLMKQRFIKNIIFATGFGETEARVIPYVKSLGNLFSNLKIVHAGKRGGDPQSEKKRQTNISSKMDKLRQELETYYSTVEIYSRIGSPHKVVLNGAESMEADIIVLGRFNEGLKEKIMGSTAEEVTRKAKCSILLVP